jgi:hypothetical protein
VHCIVSGGGVKDNQWVPAKRANGKFLFPQGALKKVFKGIFLTGLRKLLSANLLQTAGIQIDRQIKTAGFKKWNVYAKSLFENVAAVIKYLGRYTHKVAITKHRIAGITEHCITFRYKDYADGNKQKQMTLGIAEFLRRFELHFLPHRFVKTRHFGFMQNQGKTARLNTVRKQLELSPLPPKVNIPAAQRMLEQYGHDITLCPKCKKGKLELIAIIYPANYAVKLPAKANLDKKAALPNKASP